MNWFIQVFKKFAVFNGRSGRSEFWWFFLISFVVSFVLSGIDRFLGLVFANGKIGLLSGIYMLIAFIPWIAVSIRRLHDTGKTGWWLLITIVPFVGNLILLIFMVLKSHPGPNEYGAEPDTLP